MARANPSPGTGVAHYPSLPRKGISPEIRQGQRASEPWFADLGPQNGRISQNNRYFLDVLLTGSAGCLGPTPSNFAKHLPRQISRQGSGYEDYFFRNILRIFQLKAVC
jgi:hypothetical protein